MTAEGWRDWFALSRTGPRLKRLERLQNFSLFFPGKLWRSATSLTEPLPEPRFVGCSSPPSAAQSHYLIGLLLRSLSIRCGSQHWQSASREESYRDYGVVQCECSVCVV